MAPKVGDHLLGGSCCAAGEASPGTPHALKLWPPGALGPGIPNATTGGLGPSCKCVCSLFQSHGSG